MMLTETFGMDGNGVRYKIDMFGDIYILTPWGSWCPTIVPVLTDHNSGVKS